MLNQKKRLRVLLADPHAFFLETLTLLVERRHEVVATAKNGRALISQAAQLRPDVIVLEIALPLQSGLDAAPELRRMLPDVKLIFLTEKEDPYLTRQALRTRASGFLLKSSSSCSELFEAIDAAVENRIYITPAADRGMVQSFVDHPERAREIQTLTLRQREVLKALAEGKTMKEAASALNVSPRTVADHKYRIMEKLGVETTAELMQYAFRRGLDSSD